MIQFLKNRIAKAVLSLVIHAYVMYQNDWLSCKKSRGTILFSYSVIPVGDCLLKCFCGAILTSCCPCSVINWPRTWSAGPIKRIDPQSLLDSVKVWLLLLFFVSCAATVEHICLKCKANCKHTTASIILDYNCTLTILYWRWDELIMQLRYLNV